MNKLSSIVTLRLKQIRLANTYERKHYHRPMYMNTLIKWESRQISIVLNEINLLNNKPLYLSPNN